MVKGTSSVTIVILLLSAKSSDTAALPFLMNSATVKADNGIESRITLVTTQRRFGRRWRCFASSAVIINRRPDLFPALPPRAMLYRSPTLRWHMLSIDQHATCVIVRTPALPSPPNFIFVCFQILRLLTTKRLLPVCYVGCSISQLCILSKGSIRVLKHLIPVPHLSVTETVSVFDVMALSPKLFYHDMQFAGWRVVPIPTLPVERSPKIVSPIFNWSSPAGSAASMS